MVSLTEIQEVPSENVFLLVGPPGAGKSTFCHQSVLQNLAMGRPIIYVATEYGPSTVEVALRERGLREVKPELLHFIDAYNETVGVSVPDRPDTVHADCNSLSSIDIAISKLSERIGRKGVLLVFDSLTSPYLFNGSEILRFIRQTLSRFAAKGNSVVACIDEGCGKQEDVVAMMSQVRGIMKIEMEGDQRILNVMKHPEIKPAKIPFSVERVAPPLPYEVKAMVAQFAGMMSFRRTPSLQEKVAGVYYPLRKRLKGWVNILWWQIIFWGGLLWDPIRFPSLLYDMTKDSTCQGMKSFFSSAPWYMRLLLPLFLPKKLSVKAVKRLYSRFGPASREEGNYVGEYLDEISKDDEHHFRKKESALCWDFPNVGAALCYHDVAEIAGIFNALDREERNWDGFESMCLGMEKPYCEIKLTPEKSPEFQEYLRGVDASKLEAINERIMGHILSLVLHGKTLRRPSLGDGLHYHELHSGLAHFSERYDVALRMGGANSGRKIAELLLDSGVKEAEATKRLIDLFQLTKAGILAVDETVRIEENCESYGLKLGQPSCFFTTGLLNGFFSTVKNQHVKKIKCIAAGDSYCEWEFR